MIWRDIKGYEGLYSISEYGDVKSLETKCFRELKQGIVEITLKEKMIKSNRITDKTRYKMVRLSRKDSNNKNEFYLIHRLVYEAFIADIDDGLIIDHIDNDRNNNHWSNLQLITQKDNVRKHILSKNKVDNDFKRCIRCDVVKSVNEFHKVSKSKIKDWDLDNYRGHCKKCH